MIKGTFQIGGEQIEVIINGNSLMFNDISTNTISTIEGLKLSKVGVIKEFPDLKDNENWKKIAIERLKEHIKIFQSENNKLNYVKDELKKFGYESLFKQQAGWRPRKF